MGRTCSIYGSGMLADLSFPIGQIGQRTCPASNCAALMEAVRLPTRQVPKIAKGRSGNRSFFRASGARFTLKAARINANPRGDMIPRGLVPCVAVPNGV